MDQFSFLPSWIWENPRGAFIFYSHPMDFTKERHPSVIHCRLSCSTWAFFGGVFCLPGPFISPVTYTKHVIPSFFCLRYLREALPAQLRGSGDVSLQDLPPPGPAQPCLQGNFHLPGRPLPAVWRHPADLHLQQAQHEAQGDGRLDLPGPEQQRRGGAEPLAGDEGLAGDAGLQVAHAAGVLGVPRAACRAWDEGLFSFSGRAHSFILPSLCHGYQRWQGLGSKFLPFLLALHFPHPCNPSEKQWEYLQNPFLSHCLAHFSIGLISTDWFWYEAVFFWGELSLPSLPLFILMKFANILATQIAHRKANLHADHILSLLLSCF